MSARALDTSALAQGGAPAAAARTPLGAVDDDRDGDGTTPTAPATGSAPAPATGSAPAPAPAARASRAPDRYSTRGWLGKALAGTVAGFALAVSLSGIVVALTPGGLAPDGDKAQIAMWLVSPLWMTALCTCFLFSSAWRAWAWLGGGAALAYAALRALQLAAGA